MKSIRITTMLLGVLVLALLASACGPFAGSAGSPTPAPAAPAVTTAPGGNTGGTSGGAGGAATAVPTAAPQVTPGTAATAGAETREVKNVNSGLEKLKSYRVRFVYAYDGKDKSGQPQKGTANFLQEIINATKDEHMKLDQVGNAFGNDDSKATPAPAGTVFEMYRVSNNTFLINGGKCQFLTSGDSTSVTRGLFTADQLIGSNKATLIRRGESVNGVTADHYAITEAALGTALDGMKLDKGEVWISPDAYVVKIVAQLSGTNSKGSTGTGNFNYDVDNVNTQGALVAPKDCVAPTQATDIPFPANITDKRVTEAGGQTVTTFKSPDTVKVVADFYRNGMPGQGWKLDKDDSSNPVATSLQFSKDGGKRIVSVNIINAGGGTSAIISDKKSP
ncbi:MAG: hypothetical protein HZB53_18210 [Chloroflexi bacterium]|nr:hypothetical protein [Chloroflexota bacterium]